MLNLNLVQIKLALGATHGGGMQQLRIKTAQDSSSVLLPPQQQLAEDSEQTGSQLSRRCWLPQPHCWRSPRPWCSSCWADPACWQCVAVWTCSSHSDSGCFSSSNWAQEGCLAPSLQSEEGKWLTTVWNILDILLDISHKCLQNVSLSLKWLQSINVYFHQATITTIYMDTIINASYNFWRTNIQHPAIKVFQDYDSLQLLITF